MAIDLILENVRVVDGAGYPWFRGAVGVTDDRISHIVRRRERPLEAECPPASLPVRVAYRRR